MMMTAGVSEIEKGKLLNWQTLVWLRPPIHLPQTDQNNNEDGDDDDNDDDDGNDCSSKQPW